MGVFEHWHFLLKFPQKHFEVCSILGATVSGLENPNSKTQAGNLFAAELTRRDYKKIIVMLGEVDTGFVIWYRAQKYQEEVRKMLSLAVEKYLGFLQNAQHYGELIVISTPLPTIDEYKGRDEVANLRKLVNATIQERTDLTLEFNKLIKDFCISKNILYIDLDADCLGNNGIIKDCLKNKNKNDHHYDKHRYAKLLANKLLNNI